MKKLCLLFAAFLLLGLTIKAQVNLQDSLVAHYPFNGNANDESGNNHNGTVYGAMLTSDRFGNINKAYYFDGINNEIRVLNPLGSSSQRLPLSISCWIKTNTDKYTAGIVTQHDCGYGGRFHITLYGSPEKHLDADSYSSYNVRATTNGNAVSDGNWHNIIFCNTDNEFILYVDGVEKSRVASTVYQYGNPNCDLVIGGFASNSCGYSINFEGSIDDVYIYNRAINEQEIQALYNENNTKIFTPNLTIQYSNSFDIPINTDTLRTNHNVISYGFEYNYDTTKLQYLNYSIAGTLSENGSIQLNPTAGKLLVAWARQTPLIGAGTILKFQFKAKDVGTITPIIKNFIFNTDTVRNISNGTITSTVLYGDIDGNLHVQPYDAALAIQYSVGLDPIPNIDPIPWENWRIIAANVDGQGGVTAADASEILKYTVGLITTFPAQGGKKSILTSNANVNITVENGYVVFKSSGDLFGLNVFVNENKQYLGTPQILNTNMLSATNISTTSYAIGTATAYAPTNNEILMKIPFNVGVDLVPVNFSMIVNTELKDTTVYLPVLLTGIIDLQNSNFQIYPNPVDNILTLNNVGCNATISIYDISGKMLINKQITTNKIDISNLTSGVYTIKITDKIGTITKKFVKQ